MDELDHWWETLNSEILPTIQNASTVKHYLAAIPVIQNWCIHWQHWAMVTIRLSLTETLVQKLLTAAAKSLLHIWKQQGLKYYISAKLKYYRVTLQKGEDTRTFAESLRQRNYEYKFLVG